MQLTITLTGNKPMLMHNSRLANPLDQYTRKLGELTKKRNKSLDDHSLIANVEARGGCYETEDGLLGLPTANVWRSIEASARIDKLGELIRTGLSFEDRTEPILIAGQAVTCDDYLTREGSVDYRSVAIQRSRTMRARPRIAPGWQSIHTMELDTSILDADRLLPILQRAGRVKGVGDWRPVYGTYAAELEVINEVA